MKVVVVGGTGHTGTYLIPKLIEAGYDVAVISRQQQPRYPTDGIGVQSAWERVQWVEMDRAEMDAAGDFGAQVVALKPDVVIDMICYQPDSARHLAESLRGRVQLLIH